MPKNNYNNKSSVIKWSASDLPFEKPYKIKGIDEVDQYMMIDKSKNILKAIMHTYKTTYNFLKKNMPKDRTKNVILYQNEPKKITKQIILTFLTISRKINDSDWLKDITDFIEYNMFSFGKSTLGTSIYITAVREYLLKNMFFIEPEEKVRTIFETIDNKFFKPQKLNHRLKTIISTYNKWFSSFLFNLDFFTHLKDDYENNIPLFIDSDYNKYTGLINVEYISNEELINFCNQTTKVLLSRVDVPTLIKQKKITNVESQIIEFSGEELKISISKLTNDFTDGGLQYIGVLEKWLAYHQDYFKKITPLITNTKTETKAPESNPNTNPEKKVKDENNNEVSVAEKIKSRFAFFKGNCPRNNKQILTDVDFDKLIKWTVYYYENDFQVPEILKPIENINTNKTYVQLAFRYLFKNIHPNRTYPETLFKFYSKAFTPYAKDRESNFDKVKKNDVVLELMNINK